MKEDPRFQATNAYSTRLFVRDRIAPFSHNFLTSSKEKGESAHPSRFFLCNVSGIEQPCILFYVKREKSARCNSLYFSLYFSTSIGKG